MRRLPLGLLGMLALVVGFERFVQSRETTFMTPHELDWKVGGRNAERLARRSDILCFGDSMVKFGLSPRLLEERLGTSVFSLALLDGKPVSSYFLLRRAIESGARPRLIVVDFQPECMYQSNASLIENRHWKALLSVREGIDLAWTYHDWGLAGRVLVYRMLPSALCRTEIRSCIRLAFEGRSTPNLEENAKVRRNRRENRGGMLLAKAPGYRGEIPPPIADILFTPDWFNRAEHTAYVRRFLALAERHGIPVLWVLPPNSPQVLEGRERVGLDARYTAFLQRVQRRYANLTVVDGRRSGFGNEVFFDAVHLDREGAEALSLAMAEIIRPRLDGRRGLDRWVGVPSYRTPTPTIALEDVDQSLRRVNASRLR